MPELQAALCDASFFRNPRTSGGRVWHVVVVDDLAACGLAAPMRTMDWALMGAADVPEIGRCRRNGCRQRWPKEKRPDQPGEVGPAATASEHDQECAPPAQRATKERQPRHE